MSNLPQFIENSQEELDRRTKEQESIILSEFIDPYLAEFSTDDDGNLINSATNYNKAIRTDSVFDDIYKTALTGFLLWFGMKLVESAHLSIAHFHNIGVKANYKDVAFIEKQIGIVDGVIIKGSYLWKLGQLAEVRQAFQNFVLNSIAGANKINLTLRGASNLLKSTPEQPSALNKYYRKYAYDAVQHTLNTIGIYIANKRGLTHFLYEGGLVKDSRDFCIERAGKIYSREEGKTWNELDWKGKIPDMDFFIQCGGWNCFHAIVWLNNNNDEG